MKLFHWSVLPLVYEIESYFLLMKCSACNSLQIGLEFPAPPTMPLEAL